MNNTNTGGPAFPVPLTDSQESAWNAAGFSSANGMTLRDYFAAKAMQGWLAEGCEGISVTVIAKFSYEMANAMLKEREQ